MITDSEEVHTEGTIPVGHESIWLTQLDPSESDEYCKVAKALDLRPFAHPLLRIQFLDFHEWGIDSEKILTCKSLALTSPRAVQALAEVAKQPTGIASHLKSLPAFCIAGKTRDLARKAGFSVRETYANSSATLAGSIISGHISSPLLFPCGSQRRDELPTLLRKAGIEVLAVISYHSSELPQAAALALKEKILRLRPKFVMLFSPSGVKALVKLFKTSFLQEIRFIAIGETTAKELLQQKLNCAAVCKLPNAEGLREVLADLLSQA